MKIEWKVVFCVWRSTTWRATLYSLANGIVIGFIITLVLMFSGNLHPASTENHGVAQWTGAGVGFVAGVLALKQALEKNLRRMVGSANKLRIP
jgi:uncharacterized membrane-anchored protein YhcB (DUF1043 family)